MLGHFSMHDVVRSSDSINYIIDLICLLHAPRHVENIKKLFHRQQEIKP